MRIKAKNLLWLLPALLLIAGDQALKFYIRTSLPLHSTKAFLPGLCELTHFQNTGAAFSLFSEHTWILTIISGLASLLLLGLLLIGYFRKPWGMLALSLTLGGAVGNLIDRALLGYVVDMFNLEFMSFAIFNIADIGVSLGGLGICVYLLFNLREEAPASEAAPLQDESAAPTEAVEPASEKEVPPCN